MAPLWGGGRSRSQAQCEGSAAITCQDVKNATVLGGNPVVWGFKNPHRCVGGGGLNSLPLQHFGRGLKTRAPPPPPVFLGG